MWRTLRRWYKRFNPFWHYHEHEFVTAGRERKLFHAHHIWLSHPIPLEIAHPEALDD